MQILSHHIMKFKSDFNIALKNEVKTKANFEIHKNLLQNTEYLRKF